MSKQIDPNGPYQMGYDWGRLGMPANEGNPFLTERQRREWRDGYDAATQADPRCEWHKDTGDDSWGCGVCGGAGPKGNAQ